MTADDYVKAVSDHLPRGGAMRSQIAMELRGHIAERLESGVSLDEVMKQLGAPAALAESYLSAVPLVRSPFLPRVWAKAIDGLVVGLAVLPLLIVATRRLSEELAALVVVGGLVAAGLGFFAYTLGAEYWTGQTLGKHFLGLRVVRESGGPISLGQAIVRQVPVLLQIYWIDVLFALFTEKGQRAFEILSRTRVVMVAPELHDRRPDPDRATHA